MQKVGRILDDLAAGESPPTRHENPYFKQALALQHLLFSPLQLAREWSSKSKIDSVDATNSISSKKLILEVGCYMGKTLLELAQNNPDYFFLGLDITYKRGVKTAKKLSTHKIGNAYVSVCDAREFLSIDIASKLQGTAVFFPDPWPKEKQKKNRLLNAAFFVSLASRTSTDGFFWFKTDSKEYFEDASQAAADSGWKLTQEKRPLEMVDRPYETNFEELFHQKSIPTYSCVFRNATNVI